MQAIINTFPVLFQQNTARARTEAFFAPSSTTVALLAGALLLLAGAPELSVVPANEITPLEDTQGDLSLGEIVERISTHLPVAQKKEAYRLGRLVIELSDRHQISPALILAVIETESSYRFDVVSKSGAVGLMQLLPGTAAQVARRYHIAYRGAEDLNNPATNLRLGVAYLAQLRREFGQSVHYLAAYNLGPTALRKRLRSGNYDLGALDHYVRVIHERTRSLQGGREGHSLPAQVREAALLASN